MSLSLYIYIYIYRERDLCGRQEKHAITTTNTGSATTCDKQFCNGITTGLSTVTRIAARTAVTTMITAGSIAILLIPRAMLRMHAQLLRIRHQGPWMFHGCVIRLRATIVRRNKGVAIAGSHHSMTKTPSARQRGSSWKDAYLICAGSRGGR